MAKDHVVEVGDCVSSVAFENGFFWETLWNHPENQDLKSLRKDPNILLEGDVLHVPDKTAKEDSAATEQSHKYLLKGCPAEFRMRVVEEPPPDAPPTPAGRDAPPPEPSRTSIGEDPVEEPAPPDRPRKGVRYVLQIDGKLLDGKTDDDGYIQCSIPPNARDGCLTLEPGTLNERKIKLNLGHLGPLSSIAGIKARLANFGFDCGDRTEESTPAFASALRAFQQHNELEASGEPDQATKDKLKELHGS